MIDYRVRADELAVDSRKPISCVELAHRIEQALIQVEKEGSEKWRKAGFEDGVRTAADIVDRFVKDPYTSDTGTECENARNLILKLLPSQQESRIESEGKTK